MNKFFESVLYKYANEPERLSAGQVAASAAAGLLGGAGAHLAATYKFGDVDHRYQRALNRGRTAIAKFDVITKSGNPDITNNAGDLSMISRKLDRFRDRVGRLSAKQNALRSKYRRWGRSAGLAGVLAGGGLAFYGMQKLKDNN